jgi:lipoprotein-anchoring transpeptidase ErfK/SrfK
MRAGWVALCFLAFSVVAASVPAAAGVLITIDKGSQRMSVAVDGVQKYLWPVSTGARGYNTPSGSYTPFRLEEDHFSEEWDDAPMPHSIFFTQQGHAIHGSNSRLGSPLSHGCVRISPQNAATLFGLVERKGLYSTRVVVTDRAQVVTAKTITTEPSRKKKKFVSPFYMDRLQQ